MWKSHETAGHSIEFRIYEFKSVDKETIQKTELSGCKEFTNEQWETLCADPFFPEYFGDLVSDKWQLEIGSDIEGALEQKIISDVKMLNNFKDSL